MERPSLFLFGLGATGALMNTYALQLTMPSVSFLSHSRSFCTRLSVEGASLFSRFSANLFLRFASLEPC